MDPQTLHLTDALVNATCGITMWIVWSQRRSQTCFAFWGGALTVFAIALLTDFIDLRPLIGAVRYIGLATGVILMLSGFRSFDGRSGVTVGMVLCVIAPGLVFLVAAATVSGMDGPSLAAFVVSCLISIRVIAYVLKASGKRSVYRRIAGVTMAIQLIVTIGIVLLTATLLDADSIGIAIPLADQICTIVLVICILGMSVERSYREIEEMAYCDALTGALNRTGLALRLGDKLDRAGILVFDLDHFKSVNDRYGHPGGDAVLQEFVRRTSGCLPNGAVLARIGGEEFVAVLPDADHVETVTAAQDIRLAARREPIEWNGRPIGITVSVGIAILRGSESLDDAISRADSALYRAKTEGRDRIAA